MAEREHYWQYRAVGCELNIKPKAGGKFDLAVNDEVVGSYNSAQAAADDVYTCTTGSNDWDRQGTVDAPTDLSEWNLVLGLKGQQ